MALDICSNPKGCLYFRWARDKFSSRLCDSPNSRVTENCSTEGPDLKETRDKGCLSRELPVRDNLPVVCTVCLGHQGSSMRSAYRCDTRCQAPYKDLGHRNRLELQGLLQTCAIPLKFNLINYIKKMSVLLPQLKYTTGTCS